MLRPTATLWTTRKKRIIKIKIDVSCLNYIICYADIYNDNYFRFPKIDITHLGILSEG